MDAVREKTYRVYFGGNYQEHWSEDYTLSVSYEDRKFVLAEYMDGSWQAVGGDDELCRLLSLPECPNLYMTYFQAAASVYGALQDCLHRGLPAGRLSECFYCEDNPLAAPELMRLLMDDCGFSLNEAYCVTAHCCADLRCTGIGADEIDCIQPRTAKIIGLLREAAENILAVDYDSRSLKYRAPFGAVPAGTEISLSFNVLGGTAERASIVLFGDRGRDEYPMIQNGSAFSLRITPDRPEALWYSFKIESRGGISWLCPDESGYRGKLSDSQTGGFRLTVYSADFDTPKWFRKSIMYQIFPDRFGFSDDGTAEKGIEYHRALGQRPELHKSRNEPVRYLPRENESAYSPDDFYGGTFKGIEAKLPYLKKLGISCLYLNPIVEARSNHRYDTSDYMSVDPILGTEEDFERLCRSADELGIRIILDGVFSHTGADSVYFNRYGSYPAQGACQGEQSAFYPWYDFKHFPDEYRCWWGFPDLPEVDERNSAWQKYIIKDENSVVKTWLRRGASGWRLDVADELPDEALELIRKAVKAEKSDAPIIGEVWEDAVIKESYGTRRSYCLGSALDSVMNYPLRTALLDFIHGRIDAYSLRDFLISQQMNYPKPLYYSLMNLLGSHDVDRIRTALATDITIRGLNREQQLMLHFDAQQLKKAAELEKLCAAVQFSLPGVPSIYYGDEQGMCGVCDPFNRLPFEEGDGELFDYYSELAAIRNSSGVMSTGNVWFMAASSDILLILRYVNNSPDVFGEAAENGAYLTVVNRSGNMSEFDADCALAGKGNYSGIIEPYSARIIKL